MRYPPMPSEFHNCQPPSHSDFPFFLQNPSELQAGFTNTCMPNLGYFLCQIISNDSPSVQCSCMVIKSIVTAVQQVQSILTLHCPKLVQNIKIRISCDEHLHIQKIVRSRAQLSGFHFSHLEFEPSGTAVTPNPTGFKN